MQFILPFLAAASCCQRNKHGCCLLELCRQFSHIGCTEAKRAARPGSGRALDHFLSTPKHNLSSKISSACLCSVFTLKESRHYSSQPASCKQNWKPDRTKWRTTGVAESWRIAMAGLCLPFNKRKGQTNKVASEYGCCKGDIAPHVF